jgi:protein import protein ZIM17
LTQPHRHLIADHLGWFKDDDLTQGGKYKNVEDLLRAKGELVKRGHVYEDGKDEGETITILADDPTPQIGQA